MRFHNTSKDFSKELLGVVFFLAYLKTLYHKRITVLRYLLSTFVHTTSRLTVKFSLVPFRSFVSYFQIKNSDTFLLNGKIVWFKVLERKSFLCYEAYGLQGIFRLHSFRQRFAAAIDQICIRHLPEDSACPRHVSKCQNGLLQDIRENFTLNDR